jgi:hypothetical protein
MASVIAEIEKVLHPIKERVDEAIAEAKAAFDAEKGVLATDVKTALSDAKAAAEAENPALAAEAKALAGKLIEAAVAALASHGL